ncbi:MAG: DUF115 domain-containing protein [Candidatus Schekmanbacteria bacterium]|nr:DUF115 domain-containing protein [Candidatus Schekmanbacteria bacterium]
MTLPPNTDLWEHEAAASGARLVVLLGIGSAQRLAAAQTRLAAPPAGPVVLVVEADLDLLAALLSSTDAESLVHRPGQDLWAAAPAPDGALPDGDRADAEAFFRTNLEAAAVRSARDARLLPCELSLRQHPRFYAAVVSAWKQALARHLLDMASQDEFAALLVRNRIANLRFLPESLTAQRLFAVAHGGQPRPAIVVGAGPSLDRNVHLLAALSRHAFVIATDTAIAPLLRAGAEPHLAVAGDPQEEIARRFEGMDTGRCILVTELSVHPRVHRCHPPSRTAFATFEDPFTAFLERHLRPLGRLDVWGSVVTMATDLARRMGCNPVVFAGVDSAYTGGRCYCSGSRPHDDALRTKAGSESWTEVWSRYRHGRPVIEERDIFGGYQPTLRSLIAYRDWLQSYARSHPELLMLNATGGGALGGSELFSGSHCGAGGGEIRQVALDDFAHRLGRSLRSRTDAGPWERLQAATMPIAGASASAEQISHLGREALRRLQAARADFRAAGHAARTSDTARALGLVQRLEVEQYEVFRWIAAIAGETRRELTIAALPELCDAYERAADELTAAWSSATQSCDGAAQAPPANSERGTVA